MTGSTVQLSESEPMQQIVASALVYLFVILEVRFCTSVGASPNQSW